VFLLVAFLVQTALGRSSVVFEIDDNLKPIEVVLPFREFFSQLSGGKIADRAREVSAIGSECTVTPFAMMIIQRSVGR
jgi:hypothetical protein